MPKIALALIFAATATVVALAAAVLGDILLPTFRLRPHLLAGPVVAAGIGLTAGLALLERVPGGSPRAV
jgi:hypothetical protein